MSKQDFGVIDATALDLPGIMFLKKSYESLNDKDGIDYESYYRELIDEGIVIVIKDQDRIIAYCACEIQGNVFYMLDSAVHPNYLEKGLFSRLYEGMQSRLIDWCRKENLQTAHVVCHVRDDNNRMIDILTKRYSFKEGDKYVLLSRTFDLKDLADSS